MNPNKPISKIEIQTFILLENDQIQYQQQATDAVKQTK
jgi:hypothetical protein